MGRHNQIGAGKDFRKLLRRLAIIGILIVLVSMSHWVTPTDHHRLHALHVFLRKLFVLPIVLAAIWFDLRGALAAVCVATVLYLPHVFLQWSGRVAENINQLGEVVTLWVVAVVSGVFVRTEKRALRRVAEAHEGSVTALSSALDAREHETELHSLRVSAFAVRIGGELAMSEDEMRLLGQSALLHDIGKIGIPDSILLKQGSLSDEEWEVMRQHPEIGRRILLSVPFLRDAAETVYCHHERYDGSGYPSSLDDGRIPFAARVFALADVFDALTSDRPYHTKVSCEEAQALIQAGSGKHFDPEVVHAFLRIPCSEWHRIDQETRERAARALRALT